MAHMPSTRSELENLLKVFQALHSESHESVAFQNSCGGPVTISKHSTIFLSTYKTENPLIQLILTAVVVHLYHNKDGGCTLGMLICRLVLSFYNTEFHPKMYTNVLSWCSHQCQAFFPNNAQEKFRISTDSITSKIETVLSSKLNVYMSKCEVEVLVKQVAELFIMSGGEITSSTAEFIRGEDTRHLSVLHKGVILDRHHSALTLPAGLYSAVLVSCSLSGDTEQLHNATYIGHSSQPMSDAVMSMMEIMVERLSVAQVSLLICQRVIHPKVKLLLQSKGILYLERLGLKINRLLHMTGVALYETIPDRSVPIHTAELNVVHISHNRDVHLVVSSRGDNHKPVYTLALYSWTEHITNDMQCASYLTDFIGVICSFNEKMSCKQALDVLQVLLCDTRLTPGGQKWCRELIAHITTSVTRMTGNEIQKIGCNISGFRSIVDDFTRCLKKSSVQCEDVSGVDMYESLVARRSLISTAVAISNSVILTNRIIKL